MTEYHKIVPPFLRHIELGPLRNKLIIGSWSRPEFELLQDADWNWTEKVNGTNVRVIWDGYRVRFGGRTDAAQMPIKLIEILQGMFPEELLEQQFDRTEAVLYGEGFGNGIQNGSGVYSPCLGFYLFDAKVGDWWLRPASLHELATQLGIVPPVSWQASLNDAILQVRNGVTSGWGEFFAEGLVGRPPLGILGRDGDRLLVKVKHKDLYQVEEA